jgi:hypothetical protein
MPKQCTAGLSRNPDCPLRPSISGSSVWRKATPTLPGDISCAALAFPSRRAVSVLDTAPDSPALRRYNNPLRRLSPPAGSPCQRLKSKRRAAKRWHIVYAKGRRHKRLSRRYLRSVRSESVCLDRMSTGCNLRICPVSVRLWTGIVLNQFDQREQGQDAHPSQNR